MGFAKHHMMEMTEGGLSLYAADGQYACSDCFEDYALARFVRENAERNTCDYCGQHRRLPIAAHLVDIVRHIDDCLNVEYDTPENCMGWDGGEGGWQGTTYDTEELLCHHIGLDLPNDSDGELLNTITESLGDRLWCQRDPYGSTPEEILAYSWKHFCKHIKHERRYFFLKPNPRRRTYPRDELMHPAELLSNLSRFCREFGLIRPLQKGTPLVRVRQQKDGKRWTSAQDLGPPPRDKAIQTNRMSPPGVPMLYACADEETALYETASESGVYAVGNFEILKTINILDLTSVGPVPSPFDLERTETRPKLKFLHQFAQEISKPIARDNRTHIEYVPTQVITEYFRHLVRYRRKPILGIKYKSSRRMGGICYAIFATQDELSMDNGAVEALAPMDRLLYKANERWLALISCTEKTLSDADLASITNPA